MKSRGELAKNRGCFQRGSWYPNAHYVVDEYVPLFKKDMIWYDILYTHNTAPKMNFPADLVSFIEEILKEKLHILCSVNDFRILLDFFWFNIQACIR